MDEQDYLDFLIEVLQATYKSQGNSKVIYPILQENLDKLDDNFIYALGSWAEARLPEVESSEAEDIAGILCNFSNLIKQFPAGKKATNMEISITGYEISLKVFTRKSYPETWASIQNDLGNAYLYRIRYNRAENLENAIKAFQLALEVRTKNDSPIQLATIQNNLGIAYKKRIRYNRAENLEKAITAYELALSVYTKNDFPIDWAMTQNNLGNAYSERISDDRAENLEKAITAYELALSIRTKKDFPIQWAMTQINLGAVYSRRIHGNKAENVEKAIAAYELALSVYTKNQFPIQWATIQNNLGFAYSKRICGNRAENLENAIEAYKLALEVRTKNDFPIDWATTQNNLSLAYSDRIDDDRVENLENAIETYQQALSVYTKNNFPIQWATIQNNLGNTYRERIEGKKAENLENAIKAYKLALEVRTKNDFPIDWATTQNNLGAAYSDRTYGDREENLENAIKAYKLALEVRSKKDFPIDWATTQNNLGAAYSDRICGDRAQNLKKAIKTYQLALEIRTKKDFPIQWATTQHNLGLAYRDRICGDSELNLEKAIEAFQLALSVRTVLANPIKHLETTRHLGNLHFNQGEWQKSVDVYEGAIDATENIRSSMKGDDRRQKIMAEAIEVYQKLVQAYINLSQFDKAIETVERSKARNLVELFTNRDLYPTKGNVPPEIISELDELRRNIPSLERQLQVATDQLSENSNEQKLPSLEESRKRLQQELQESRQQLDELLKQINDRYDSSFTLTQKVKTIPFSDIQSLIDERTAIIEWYLTRDEIITFIVTSHSQQPIIIPQSSPEKLKTLENWEQEYINAYREQKNQWITNLFTRLTDLAQILNLDSILSEIDAIFDQKGIKCDRLILIPHRFLHLFPLHALPLSNSNEELLLDRFARGVSYAPSCQLLKLTKQGVADFGYDLYLLAIAKLLNNKYLRLFSLYFHILIQQRPKQKHSLNFKNLFAIQNPTRLDEKPLLGSKLEVDKIRQYFDPNDSIVLAEAEATEANLNQNQEQLRSAHCLHFSCHGKFKFESPLESALLLSDPEGKLKADADLTLYKIFKLDLSQCRIVSFSACESGMTLSGNKEDADLPSGLDEYIGLPSGFLYAGSPSVVSTLWTVDPIATALLVIKFYKNLKQLPKLGNGDVSTALIKAQYWLRTLSSQKLARIQKNKRFKLLIAQIFENNKSDRRKFNDSLYAAIKLPDRQPYPFANPYYWAASVATGT
ncbi:MAG: tetratricopeptide repeat protein [Okeania sp. SIO3C4]|nr:tetratricopeptide repeat protein [Okeania sp. SIO3C4]